MTVAELIAKLREMPQDVPVRVEDSEERDHAIAMVRNEGREWATCRICVIHIDQA